MSENAPSLLIIDDQPDSIGLLLAFLEGRSLDIAVALDGIDGLSKAERLLPDLILLDVVMPGIDGFTVCHRLKANPRTADIPVIFLSGITDVADKLQGFAAGGVDYITKPFVAEEVLVRIFVQLQTRHRLARLEAMAVQRALEGEAVATDRDGRIFAAAAALLEERMTAPPGLVELAHSLGTNERKLNEIFRQRVGMTVFDYLAELRLETARRLLDKADYQIRLIAEKVGYRNAGDFSRAFRNRYQVTPREYRKAYTGMESELDE